MVSWYKLLAQKIRAFAVSKVGFWSGQLYDFSAAEAVSSVGSSLSSSVENKWIVIVGRDYYLESVKDYPIGIRRDVREVLKHERQSAPFEGIRFFMLERTSEKSHRVTSWLVKQNVIDALPFRPWFLVPETVCIDPSQGAVAFDRLGQRLFFEPSADGIRSHLVKPESSSSQKTQRRILDSLEMDRQSDLPIHNESQTTDQYLRGILQLMQGSLMSFRLKPKPSTYKLLPWREGSILAGLGLCVYLALSSTYIALFDVYLDSKLLSLEDSIDAAVSARTRVDELGALDSRLSDLTARKTPYWLTWPVFLDLVSLDNIMVANRASEGVVTFVGRSENAADTLDYLQKDSRIASAEFALPIRTIAELEAFTINVTFHDVLGDTPIYIGRPQERTVSSGQVDPLKGSN